MPSSSPILDVAAAFDDFFEVVGDFFVAVLLVFFTLAFAVVFVMLVFLVFVFLVIEQIRQRQYHPQILSQQDYSALRAQ